MSLLSAAFLLAAISARDIVSIPTPFFARLSPDGDRILTVVAEPDASGRELTQAVWVIEKDGHRRRVVEGGGNPRWSPRGDRIAFVKAGSDGRQLWISSADGSGARKMTSLPDGVGDHAWSPDGRRIAILNRQIHLLDVESGDVRKLTDVPFVIINSPWHPDGNLSWAPDGRAIAFAGKPSPKFDDEHRSDIYTVAMEGAVRKLTSGGGMNQRPAWSPDGKWIAFRSTFGKVDRYANHGLLLVSPRTGEMREVGRGFELGFLDGPYWHDWSADSRSIFYLAPDRGSIQLFRLNIASGSIMPMTATDAAVLRPSLSGARDSIAFLRSSGDAPWEIWSMSIGGQALRRAGFHSGAGGVRYERTRWKAPDGLEMEGLLARPEGGSKLPVVVYLHGGPEGMIFAGYSPEVPIPAVELHVTPPQYYVARGWAVFYPNFRGSGGYGERNRRAAMTDWSGGFAGDVLAGVDHLVATGIADPARLYLAGAWRSGSTKVTSLLTQTSRFRAAAAFSPYPNIEAIARERDDFHLQHHALFGGSPDANPEAWAKHDPIRHATKITTPLLLIHDEADAIRSKQSLDLHSILKEKGVPGRLVLYRSMGLRDEAAVIEETFEWFASNDR
jgi:dipeptidyl aminopeptidase/acylaminoacyl peptidase